MAVKNITAILNEITLYVNDNSVQDIQSFELREILQDLADSSYNKITDKSLIGLSPYNTFLTYNEGQAVTYDDGGGRFIYWASVPVTTAGAFNPLEWERLPAESQDNKGIANGYVPLNGSIKIDSIYLPSYVDDVLEFANLGAFPVTGETGKIYIAIDSGLTYRWTGSIYVQINSTSAVWGGIAGTITAQTDLINYLQTNYINDAVNGLQIVIPNRTVALGGTLDRSTWIDIDSFDFGVGNNTYIYLDDNYMELISSTGDGIYIDSTNGITIDSNSGPLVLTTIGDYIQILSASSVSVSGNTTATFSSQNNTVLSSGIGNVTVQSATDLINKFNGVYSIQHTGSLYKAIFGGLNVLSSDRTYTFQNASGTLAFTSDLTAYLNKAGGTMTGSLILASDPISSLEAVTKQYVDNLVQGLKWKEPVVCRTTANITLSGTAFSLDGVPLNDGNRVLVMNQTNQTENGIYIANSGGAWTRTNDANTGTEILSSTVYIQQGTIYSGTIFTNNNNSIIIGVTNITFVQMAGAGSYSAGTGLQLSGTTFSINSTVATLTGSQTLTNKTLTSPIINVTSDATGDIYYRNSGGQFTRLGIGTAGHVLTVSGGVPVWSAPSGGGATILSANTTITEGSWSGNTDYQYSVNITGAVVGDFCLVQPNNTVLDAINTAGTEWRGYAYCSSANTVTVVCRVGTFVNVSGIFTTKVIK